MARAYRDVEDAPGAADMDFDELLAMIVDAEWDARRASGRMRLLRQASFSAPDANIADIRCDPDRKLDRDRIVGLAGCDWIRNARNVVVTGATGAGNYAEKRIMSGNGLPPQVIRSRQPRPFA